jgi:hypothetical protein
MEKVIDSPFPSPPSFLFYFSFPLFFFLMFIVVCLGFMEEPP